LPPKPLEEIKKVLPPAPSGVAALLPAVQDESRLFVPHEKHALIVTMSS